MTRLERFLSLIDKTSSPRGCWLYLGSKTKRGYGRIGKRSRILAHQLSYSHFKGPIPPGQIIRHSCDTPPCVNPDHLLAGTHTDNARDRVERHRQPSGANAPAARLTQDQVVEIRRRYRPGKRGSGCVALAHEFGVSNVAVHKIVTGRTWKALADERALETA